MTIYDFQINDINGNSFDWNTVKGKKILIVNTASECGYTFHYEPLEELYQSYKEKGFIVLGFPCNDFGGQEPGSEKEIVSFCQKNYGVTFPLMSKVAILGENVHPIYNWLTSETNTEVKWNFQKYLVNTNGKVEKMIPHNVLPNVKEIITWIEK